ncbi:hypothetical protein NN561_000915 [Cricetulus griseus]
MPHLLQYLTPESFLKPGSALSILPAEPVPPDHLILRALDTSSLQAFWNISEGATSLYLMLTDFPGATNLTAVVKQGVSNHTFLHLSPGTPYKLRLYAVAGPHWVVGPNATEWTYPFHPSDLVLTPLPNELWASWEAGPGARDSYVLKLSGPVENTSTLGPEECNAVFPGPLPLGHYTLRLKVLAGPYDAWIEASTWLAEPAALPRESPGARLWLDGLLEATKQPGRRALLYAADAPGLLGNISVPFGATHVTFCGLVPGAHYRVDIASSVGDITQSITGYTRPLPPQSLEVINRSSPSDLTIRWVPAPGQQEGYKFTWHQDGSQRSPGNLVDLGPDNSSLTLRSLVPGSCYTVSAWAWAGNLSSNLRKIHSCTRPAPPTNLSLGFSTQPATLRASWSHPQGGRDGFQLRLYRLRPLALESEKILSREARNFSWAKLAAGSEFQVQLATLWGSEESSSANATGWTPPLAPTLVNVTSEAPTQLQALWVHAPGGRHSYQVSLYQEGARTATSIMGSKANSTTFSGLTPGTKYKVEVISWAGPLYAAASNVSAWTYPLTPNELLVSMQAGSAVVNLAWPSGPLGQGTCHAQLSDAGHLSWEQPLSPGQDHLILTHLTPGHTILMFVKCQAGPLQASTHPVVLSVEPGPVEDVLCQPGATHLVLNWTMPVGDVDACLVAVEQLVGGGSAHFVFQVNTSEDALLLPNLMPATSYRLSLTVLGRNNLWSRAVTLVCTTSTEVWHPPELAEAPQLELGTGTGVTVTRGMFGKDDGQIQWYGIIVTSNMSLTRPSRESVNYTWYDHYYGGRDSYMAVLFPNPFYPGPWAVPRSWTVPVGTEDCGHTQEICNGHLKPGFQYRRTHRPIPIHSFRQSYEAKSAHAHQAFFQEFEGYSHPQEFIATQGPLKKTVEDFWRLVWEQQVHVIIMLTVGMENGRVLCEHYWPANSTPVTHGHITIHLLAEEPEEEWTRREFQLQHDVQQKQRRVKQLQFTTWPDHSVPEAPSSLLKFVELVREQVQVTQGKGPTLVHCSAGVGRTGTFVALLRLLQQLEEEQMVDVFNTVYMLRLHRPLMIQTPVRAPYTGLGSLDPKTWERVDGLPGAGKEVLGHAEAPGSGPISVMNFAQACAKRAANANAGFLKEYKLLKQAIKYEAGSLMPPPGYNQNSVVSGDHSQMQFSTVEESPADNVLEAWLFPGGPSGRDHVVLTGLARPKELWELVWEHGAHVLVSLGLPDTKEKVNYSKGTNQLGTFLAMEQLLQQAGTECTVDVFNVALKQSQACGLMTPTLEDGIMLSADCSELGLSVVPGDLDPLTAYLETAFQGARLMLASGPVMRKRACAQPGGALPDGRLSREEESELSGQAASEVEYGFLGKATQVEATEQEWISVGGMGKGSAQKASGAGWSSEHPSRRLMAGGAAGAGPQTRFLQVGRGEGGGKGAELQKAPQGDTSQGDDGDTTQGDDGDTTQGDDGDTSQGDDEDTTQTDDEDITQGDDRDTTQGDDGDTSQGDDGDTTQADDGDTTQGDDGDTTQADDGDTSDYFCRLQKAYAPDARILEGQSSVTFVHVFLFHKEALSSSVEKTGKLRPRKMLQSNQLRGIPAEALWELPSLQSLRLDANLISLVPERSFEGLSSLRHLWLDDNALTEIPVRALNNLPALQAMTLALNHIRRIPDYAFQNLTSLVVLHLHNNLIQHVGTHSFEGLHNLETLDLNYNELQEFPVAIRTLGRLQELGFHNNNIKAIPEKAFMGNPLLQTISLNGATDIQEFPDLKGTTSLEILTLTRAGIRLLPPGMCQQLPKLRILELSHNQIEELPSLHRCQKLEEIDLSWNAIRAIHPEAFSTLHSLVKLDLTDNQLTTLPLAGLGGLMHLKLKGNLALSQAFSKDSFPKLRILEVPYAYQCCAYGICASFFKTSGQWQAEDFHLEEEEAPKRPLGLLAGQAENHYDLDLDELQLEMEDSKPQPSVQCSPVPGPFKPCEHLFESWGIRLAVWAIVLLSVLCNGLVLLTVFAGGGPSPLSPVKLVVGAIAGANALTGISCGLLASVDALTFGQFAEYGARWETGLGCQATGFLAVLGSEASVLLLTLAAVQCSVSVTCVRAYGKAPSPGSVRAGALGCLALAGLAAALPLASVGEYGASPLCLPYAPPEGRPAALGFAVALVMMNSLCFLVVAGAYIKLYCDLPRGDFEAVWDCAMVRHVAWLIFTDGLLYCPVAFLSFASMLGLFPVTPEAVKSVLLVVLPLPACLNPLLYLLFNPHFRDDLRRLWPTPRSTGPLAYAAASELEKSSCDSTQALVAFSDVDLILEASEAGQPPGLETYGFPSVTLISRQQPGATRLEGNHFVDPDGTQFGNPQPPINGELLLRAEGTTLAGRGSAASGVFWPSGSLFASHL